MTQSMPLVTVIIACYNHEKYIEQSISSVLEQTYGNVELLVIDDGSTDDSVAVIKRLLTAHDFNFIEQANQGLSKTLNEAIRRAQGSLIAPFGSDDVMLPDRLRQQVEYLLDKPSVGICAGDIQAVNRFKRRNSCGVER